MIRLVAASKTSATTWQLPQQPGPVRLLGATLLGTLTPAGSFVGTLTIGMTISGVLTPIFSSVLNSGQPFGDAAGSFWVMNWASGNASGEENVALFTATGPGPDPAMIFGPSFVAVMALNSAITANESAFFAVEDILEKR